MHIFDDISKEEIIKLTYCFKAITKTYQKESIVIPFMNHTNIIGVILSGNIDIASMDYNGNKNIIKKLKQNDIFTNKMFEIENQEISVLATTDTEILFFDYENLLKRCNKNCPYHITILNNFINILSNTITEYNEKIQILSQRSIREKLLTYFEINTKKKGKKSFDLEITFTDLADFLSIDRSAMMRELKNLKDENIIEIINKKITVLY